MHRLPRHNVIRVFEGFAGYGSNGKVDEFIAAVNKANWGITLTREE